MLNLFSRACQVHIVSTARWTFYLKGFTIVLMESLERLDQEEVYTAPYGTSPVGVSAELLVSQKLHTSKGRKGKREKKGDSE